MPSFNDYPQHVEQLIQAALAAADPGTAVTHHLKFNGRSLTVGRDPIIHTQPVSGRRIFLISVGKASVPMGVAAAEILGPHHIAGGIVIAKKGERDWQAEIGEHPLKLYQAGHPVSDEDSVTATTAVIELLAQTTPHDLVLCLISGGTSALLTQPIISLADWQQLTQALLDSGCTINELNCVRRQLDQVKGGGLARLAAPATCISLILSDVVGNPLEVIGSGPTAPIQETLGTAAAILARYQVGSRLDTAVWGRIIQALQSLNTQPPPPATHAHNLIIGDVRQTALAALVKAAQIGFTPQLLTAQLEGEAREVGKIAAALAKDSPPSYCLIMGGETTVTIRGNGRGGRNQELALSAAIALNGQPNRVVASFATDGEDGPTNAAGAVVSGQTVTDSQQQGLNPITFLERNDSYVFFEQLDRKKTIESDEDDSVTEQHPPQVIKPAAHIKTGSTGTNVNDLIFILSYPNEP